MLSISSVGENLAMGIGAQSPSWRRALYRTFRSVYFRRKCNTTDGVFEAYVSPSSYLSVLDFRKSLVHPVHRRFIDDWINSDSIVWDIGSNLGLFTLPAALKTTRGRVYAFEPDAELVANFLRSLRLPRNKRLAVASLCLAISNKDGIAAFQISKFSRAMNKLEGVGTWHESQVVAEEMRSVVTMRIDTLAKSLEAPTVLKIDVEGAEVNVLEGGEETISKHRPAMLVEGPSELRDPLRNYFQRHNYVLLDGQAAHQIPLQNPVWDTVAVPREKYSAR
jgi:FkbM family methyltransferase